MAGFVKPSRRRILRFYSGGCLPALVHRSVRQFCRVGRSKAQAAFLRSAKREIPAKKLDQPLYGSNYAKAAGSGLKKDDVVFVEAGDFIPGDSDVIEDVATVDESASRQRTPNEIALAILLVALILVFLMATVTLLPFSVYSVESAGSGQPISITALMALLVCLIPTTKRLYRGQRAASGKPERRHQRDCRRQGSGNPARHRF